MDLEEDLFGDLPSPKKKKQVDIKLEKITPKPSKKRPITETVSKPTRPVKQSKPKRNTLVTKLKNQLKKGKRDEEILQKQREISDYIFVEQNVAPVVKRNRKLSIYNPTPAQQTEPVVLSETPSEPTPRPVNHGITGSRNTIQKLKLDTKQLSTKLTYVKKKYEQLLVEKKSHISAIEHPITKIEEEKKLKEFERRQASLASTIQELNDLPSKLDRVISEAITLAALEGRTFRLAPNSRIYGLVVDSITEERNNELITRLARTPLTVTQNAIDGISTYQLTTLRKALYNEITSLMDNTPVMERIQLEQNALLDAYEKIINSTTTPQSESRTRLYQHLKSLRLLQAHITKIRKKGVNKTGISVPTADPSTIITPIPAPGLNLDEQTFHAASDPQQKD